MSRSFDKGLVGGRGGINELVVRIDISNSNNPRSLENGKERRRRRKRINFVSKKLSSFSACDSPDEMNRFPYRSAGGGR